MHHVSRFPFPVLALLAAPLAAQQSLPPLPDTSGFGVHVLALGRAPDDAVWVGTYGQGIFVLRRGAGSWEQFKHSDDSTARTISFEDRKSTRLNSSHGYISYAVFCLKKKTIS